MPEIDGPGLMQPQERINTPLLQRSQKAEGAKPAVGQEHIALG
jgi:hypothetical protein